MDVALDDPLLQTAWRELDSNFELKHVWEQGFWQRVFGDEDVLHPPVRLKRPAVVPIPDVLTPSSTPAQKKTRTVCNKGHWMQVVRNIDELSWREELDAKRDTAIKRWFDLFACFPASFQVAAQLRELGSIDEQLRMIRDVLSGKSPQTMVKRANSLLRFTQFLRSKQVEFPGSEALLYEMFCEMRAGGAPSSRLQGVVEAIRFTHYTFCINGLVDTLLSARCLGAARKLDHGVKKQASPFTVKQLVGLHDTSRQRSAYVG